MKKTVKDYVDSMIEAGVGNGVSDEEVFEIYSRAVEKVQRVAEEMNSEFGISIEMAIYGIGTTALHMASMMVVEVENDGPEEVN